MQISNGVLGVLRSALSIAIWGAGTAVLNYFSDATHLAAVFSPYLAGVVALLAGYIEHQMEAAGQGALFGAVK